MDRITDENTRDLTSELEREANRLRTEVDTSHKVIIGLLLLLAVAFMWAAHERLDRDFATHVTAYEIADRCVRECDCSHIGLDR